MATIRRLGLNAYRIAMILSVLSGMQNTPKSNPLLCSDKDFHTSLEIVRVLTKHASHIFSDIESGNIRKKTRNRKERYLAQLPEAFNRQTYLKVAAELNITTKTAERYIHHFIKYIKIHHDAKDCYEKYG